MRISIFTYLLWVCMQVYAQSDCELKKDSDSIFVYSCKSMESSFNSIKAEFEMNAQVSQYANIALNVQDYHLWHYKSINQKLLKKISESEMIYYSEIVTPWPVSNRDMILHFKITQNLDNKEVTVILKSLPDYIPRKDGIVRIPKSYSVLNAIPVSTDRIKITYYMEVDPGGIVPAWIVNMFSVNGPWESFTRLREIVASGNYKKGKADFILD